MSVRLPILSVLFLQLILSLPTSSFSGSLSPPRRIIWTPLQAVGNTYNNDGAGSDVGNTYDNDGAGSDVPDEEQEENNNVVKKSANVFERAVRKVTRNDDYKFGDLTRTVVNTTTHGVEGAVRAVTRDEDYRFGDLTKKAIGSSKGGIEGVVKSVTGNDEYQFGDLTKGTIKRAGGVLTYSEKTLGLMREANIHEFVELMNFFWTKSMNDEERKEAFAVVVYLGAIVVLSYNFVANVMSGMVLAAAWTKSSMATGMSPLSPGMWSKFLETKSTLELFFGGPCLPVRAIITIPFFFSYRKFVVARANYSPLRERFPIINRCMSLILAWVVANLAFVGGMTFLMVKVLSLWTGVPVFPVVV
ncbi:hypothetical protein ACHAXR_007905 [Thalassiosira sp. AJA248-18]